MSNRKRRYATFLALMVLCASCASIIKGKHEDVEFRSKPSGAVVTVLNHDDVIVAEGTTPCELSLKRSRGYFKRGRFKARYELAGYKPVQLKLKAGTNAWYWLGNIVFGGLIGWLIVDPATGGMWTISRDPVTVDFVQASLP